MLPLAVAKRRQDDDRASMLSLARRRVRQFTEFFGFKAVVFLAIITTSAAAGFQVENKISDSAFSVLDNIVSAIFIAEILLKMFGYFQYFLITRMCMNQTCEKELVYNVEFVCKKCEIDAYCSGECQLQAMPHHWHVCKKRAKMNQKEIVRRTALVHRPNYWNIFDFIIVAAGLSNSGNVRILRLLRFIRVLRLVRAITTLRMLISGLIKSFGSIFYIAVLCLILFFIYGVMGILLFDDHPSFSNFETTFITLWYISFGATWTTPMYSILFKCHEETGPRGLYPYCRSVSDPLLGAYTIVYFVSFTVFSSWVLLNLIIGVVTSAMATARERIRNEEKEAAARASANTTLLQKLDHLGGKISAEMSGGPAPTIADLGQAKDTPPEPPAKSKFWWRIKEAQASRSSEEIAFDAYVIQVDEIVAEALSLQRRARFLQRQMNKSPKEKLIRKPTIDWNGSRLKIASDVYLTVSWVCKRLVRSKKFDLCILFTVFLGAVQTGAQVSKGGESLSFLDPNGNFIFYLAHVINAIFCFEAIIRCLSHRLRPWEYIVVIYNHKPFLKPNIWNIFDVILVILSYATPQLAFLRILRILRIFKLVRMIPTLQILVAGLISSFSSILYILLLCFLLFYIYAIAGVNFLNDVDPVHFENLGMAFLSLIQTATRDSWDTVTTLSIYGCSSWSGDYPEGCDDARAANKGGKIAILYWVSFMMLAAMIVLNLIIGVISASMSDITLKLAEMESDLKEEEKQSYIIATEKLKKKVKVEETPEIIRGISNQIKFLARVRPPIKHSRGRNLWTVARSNWRQALEEEREDPPHADDVPPLSDQPPHSDPPSISASGGTTSRVQSAGVLVPTFEFSEPPSQRSSWGLSPNHEADLAEMERELYAGGPAKSEASPAAAENESPVRKVHASAVFSRNMATIELDVDNRDSTECFDDDGGTSVDLNDTLRDPESLSAVVRNSSGLLSPFERIRNQANKVVPTVQ